MKTLWKYITEHKVWSSVLAMLIATAILAGIGYGRTFFTNAAGAMTSIMQTRVAMLNGSTWHAKASQIPMPGEKISVEPIDITYRFKVKGNRITGTGTFSRNDQLYEVSISGEFYNESTLRLEYKHEKGINAFGYIILNIDQVPNKMSGKCVVLGSQTHQISVGALELTKVEH